jgi:hypothetical protein
MSFEDGLTTNGTTAFAETRLTDVPSLDKARYAPHLGDMELSEAQQADLLGAIWTIMCAFVDLGFGVDSVQTVLPFLREISSGESPDQVECEQTPNPEIFEAAAHDPARKDDQS